MTSEELYQTTIDGLPDDLDGLNAEITREFNLAQKQDEDEHPEVTGARHRHIFRLGCALIKAKALVKDMGADWLATIKEAVPDQHARKQLRIAMRHAKHCRRHARNIQTEAVH
jgi:hypothetical protein